MQIRSRQPSIGSERITQKQTGICISLQMWSRFSSAAFFLCPYDASLKIYGQILAILFADFLLSFALNHFPFDRQVFFFQNCPIIRTQLIRKPLISQKRQSTGKYSSVWFNMSVPLTNWPIGKQSFWIYEYSILILFFFMSDFLSFFFGVQIYSFFIYLYSVWISFLFNPLSEEH